MHRRDFLGALSCAALGQIAPTSSALSSRAEAIFLDIVRGYVASASRTSDSYAVVEYPDATVTQSFLAKSGSSVTGVTRMMPALAAWIAARRQPGVLSVGGKQFDLLDVVGSALVNGTNPEHKDYWGASPADAQNQRQVESSVVAWSLWLLRDTLLPQMSTLERRRIDDWLASCTQREVRRNNWAWFTAVNIAARIALKDRFDEFSFNQRFMFDDLQALDAMYAGDGWFNDDKPRHSFDYYNAWVFASHFLYWNAMVGSRFPEWSQRFAERLLPWLRTAPLFFGSNGSHILYGRSLVYRWGVLTPLVLAYTQRLWPHDPGLLSRLLSSSLDFHRQIGSFDAAKGKLRETYSAGGAVDIHESYIDGGHPYWGMQAFSVWLIGRQDVFWTAPPAPLPVEKADFVIPLHAPGLVVSGSRSSGQVRLLQARSTKTDLHYRDKYNKLTYSSHFPFNIVQRADICPWDNTLVLRDTRKRRSVGRSEIEESRLFSDGMEIAYSLVYDGHKVSVRSTVILGGDWDARLHRVICPADMSPGIEIAEGSSTLGLDTLDQTHSASERFSLVRNRTNGFLIGSWSGEGWRGLGAAWDFGAAETAGSNVIAPYFLVNTLWAPLRSGVQMLSSVHYASPKPLAPPALHARAAKLLARLRNPDQILPPAQTGAVKRSTAGGSRRARSKGRP